VKRRSNIIKLSIRWMRVVSFTIQPLYPPGRGPVFHYTGGWVGFGAGVFDLEKKKTYFGVFGIETSFPLFSRACEWVILSIPQQQSSWRRPNTAWTTHRISITLVYTQYKAGIAQSIQWLPTGWKVRRSNPGGVESFRTRSDWPWGPTSLLYNG